MTERSSARLVRAVLDGEAIQLPTDEGLSSSVVGRSDYVSVAPRRELGRTAAGIAIRSRTG